MTDPKKDNHVLDCAEFQEQLPQMFAGDGEPNERPELRAHLTTCANCSALVRDLEYIAEQARLLLEAVHDPSPDVWSNIQSKLAGNGKTH